MEKIKLIASIPNPVDATSLYRAMGPLLELRRILPQLEIMQVPEHSWVTYKMCDIFFMQRPYTKDHLGMVEMAKDNGKKVWVDYDDDLLDVPDSNSASKVYGKEETQKTIAKIIASADVVTVSTAYLKRKFSGGEVSLNKNVVVIPNAFDDYLLRDRTKPPEKRNPLVSWRGSVTHHKDLFEFGPEIIETANTYKHWTFQFLGDKPWFLFERLDKNSIFIDHIDPIQYFRMLHLTKPVVGMVPLHDCGFNRAKSNIAWIETVYAGGIAIAPNWEEWRKPGALNYEDGPTFRSVLESCLKGEIQYNQYNADGWSYIQDELVLSKVNLKRKEIILSLL